MLLSSRWKINPFVVDVEYGNFRGAWPAADRRNRRSNLLRRALMQRAAASTVVAAPPSRFAIAAPAHNSVLVRRTSSFKSREP